MSTSITSWLSAAVSSLLRAAGLENVSASPEAAISAFVRHIWVHDVCPTDATSADVAAALILLQERTLGLPPGLLRAPLPVALSRAGPTMLSQLLISCGDDAAALWEVLQHSARCEGQAAKVAIAAAPTGAGKTHMAYTLGASKAYLVFVRVILDSGTLSPPFEWLSTRLSMLQRKLRSLSSPTHDDAVMASRAAVAYVRLVLLAHVEAALIALRVAHSLPNSSDPQLQRQLLLRFFRHDGVDEAVVALLERCYSVCGAVDSHLHPDTLLHARLRYYEQQLAADVRKVTKDDPILITVDEAHQIMTHHQLWSYADLVRRSTSIIEQDFDGKRDDGLRSVILNEHAVLPQRRNLFYALVVTLSELSTKHLWRTYITGTSLSMAAVFAGDAGSSVQARTTPVPVAPQHVFTVDDMCIIMRHYWHIPSTAFDLQILNALSCFQGRAVLFVDGVWLPFVSHVLTHHSLPSAHLWYSMLLGSLQTLLYRWQELASAKLHSNRAIHQDGTGTRALIPRLVRAVIADDGIINLDTKEIVDEAIRSSLLFAKAGGGETDIKRERITAVALFNVIRTFIDDGVVLDIMLRSAMRPVLGAKGTQLELAIAWHLALTVIRGMVPGSDSAQRIVSLTEREVLSAACAPSVMLSEWITAVAPRAAACMSGVMKPWCVEATRVVDAGGSHDCLRLFLTRDGKLDLSVILVNLPANMGIDVACIAHCRTPLLSGELALVAMQCKNARTTSIERTMLTLHPGTQYLTNEARKKLVLQPLQTAVRSSSVRDLPGRHFLVAAATHPVLKHLLQHWIRVVVVAQRVSEEVYDFSRAAALGDVSAYPTAGWTTGDVAACKSSPVLWLSISDDVENDRGLSDTVRRHLLADNAELVPSTLSLRSEHLRLWIPVSVSRASEWLASLSDATPLPPVGSLAGRKRGSDSATATAIDEFAVDAEQEPVRRQRARR